MIIASDRVRYAGEPMAVVVADSAALAEDGPRRFRSTSILTRTKAMTARVAIVNFMHYEGREWAKIAAGRTLVMLPVVAFSVVVYRYLVRGLTAGGVKE